MTDARAAASGTRDSELGAAILLAVVGMGVRLFVVTRFPTIPFWDFANLVDFGKLLHEHGIAADGWFWSQVNPGLPVILSLLFRIPGDPSSIARMATAVATGWIGVLPFVIWKGVVPYRFRLLGGLLLALWPGQVLFAGVVAQDNWVLLPAIGLGCLATRTLLADGPPRPALSGVLYVAAVAMRQEMALVLLPLLVPAALRHAKQTARARWVLAVVLATGFLLLLAQRYAATGRLAWTTEHGVLALCGSFMPGASEAGWVDARAYAAALYPESATYAFGDRKILLRMTLDEVRRRPGFHALRVAAWLPRLALTSDADNLGWSLGLPQSQPPSRRPAAAALARRWQEPLLWELALIQGLFCVALVDAIRTRRVAILVLALAVALKYVVHMIISPVGRLVVPATAFELLGITLYVSEWPGMSRRRRGLVAALALAVAVAIKAGVPRLAEFVVRRDTHVLPGVERFSLRIDGGGSAECRLERGAVMGLGPKWAAFGTIADDQGVARVSCVVTPPDPGGAVRLMLRDPTASYGTSSRRRIRVSVDREPAAAIDLAGQPIQAVELGSAAFAAGPARVDVELSPRETSAAWRTAEAPVQIDFARSEPRAAGGAP
ncbi:MAG TPA: hypothetical protein VKG23_14275 [Thermoanaerobaculia bacterium]|nr:hypothetical protein [Thermoanaerobaculia bacterium]